MNRYVYFAIIVIVSVVADHVTKYWAEQNLASRTSRWNHGIERVVDDAQNGMTIEEWIGSEFGIDVEDPDQRRLVRSIYEVNPETGEERGPLSESTRIESNDQLRVYHREMVVIPGFWNHIYVQNFGAAWGILSEQNERFRRPFFLVVSVIAVVFVMVIFRGLRSDQRLMMTALSCIVGGAVGNFIDRVRYGYVIDFIDWYVGRHHWPTFNVADAAITAGVGLLLSDWVLEVLRERKLASNPAVPLTPQETSD